MAQIYAPRAQGVQPAPIAASAEAGGRDEDKVAAAQPNKEDAAVDFAHKRDALASSIERTTGLVQSLSKYNTNKWTMHYPHHKLGCFDSTAPAPVAAGASSSASAGSSATSTTGKPDGAEEIKTHASALRMPARRAASMFGEAEDVLPRAGSGQKPPSPIRPGFHSRAFSSIDARSTSSAEAEADAKEEEKEKEERANHPLALDLRLGAPGSTSIPALMESMSQATIAQLLSKRFEAALAQLSSLSSRVKDNQSRILVTGDLNAGKSTFVNALLRRDILPTDQQPLTTVFCEVLDAQAYNNGVEEVHAILSNNLDKYSRTDKTTHEKFSLEDLEEIATSEEQKYGLVKIYLEDSRAPVDTSPDAVINHERSAEEEAAHNTSFIRNGIVSISLIDGPGLNKDGASTTAIFARQTEIDVIVFVVDAYNHFTLSSADFVWNASMEKAYIFMVVNKFKSLRQKEKCRRLVGEKIRQLSPKTWENREELVHFVEAGDVLRMVRDIEEGKVSPLEASSKKDEAFLHLEDSLRSFLMQKRTISKLAPAKHYLINLLSNLATVAETNISAADLEYDDAERRLAFIKPLHERLEKEKEAVEHAVGKEEDDVVASVRKATQTTLDQAVEFIGSGETNHTLIHSLPEYPGLMDIWNWAETVKKTLLDYIETRIVAAEEDARQVTIGGVKAVTDDLAKQYLPANSSTEKVGEKVATEKQQYSSAAASGAASAMPQRVFRSEAMFAKNRKRRAALRKEKERAAQENSNKKDESLTLSTSAAPEIELSLMDLFDLERLYSLPSRALSFAHGKGKFNASGNSMVEATSALSVVSLGAGALTMFGSRVIGLKSLIEAVTTTLEVLGSRAARKWAAPIAGLLSLGLAAYVIHDLPRAVPHNVGRKLHASLIEHQFSGQESERIASEARKVMRLAGWDLRERFRAALEASEKDRRSEEGRLRKADDAIRFLEGFLADVEQSRSTVRSVQL